MTQATYWFLCGRYLCKLTDKDLRQPDGRQMVDAMWSAVKGPVESGPICDKYVDVLVLIIINPLNPKIRKCVGVTNSHLLPLHISYGKIWEKKNR